MMYVHMANGPDELYYMDLLEEDPYTPYSNLALEFLGRTEEDLARMDQDTLNTLLESIPEGWHSCSFHGTNSDWFARCDLYGRTGRINQKPYRDEILHFFQNYGVPATFRILVATKSGEVFCSQPLRRYAEEFIITLDWSTKTVTMPPILLRCILQFLAIFVPTILIKGAILPLFRLWAPHNRKVYFLVTLMTQGALALWYTIHSCTPGVAFYSYLYLIIAEAGIIIAELLLYCECFENSTKGNSAFYTLFANLFSTILAWCLLEPIYRIMVLL